MFSIFTNFQKVLFLILIMFAMAAFAAEYNPANTVLITGYNAAVANTIETLTPTGDGPYFQTTAEAVKIASTSANDTLEGTGARSAIVYGVSNGFVDISETVNLSGNTIATTTQLFRRVNKIKVYTCGTGGTNAGTIYCFSGTATAGVPDDATKVWRVIPIAKGNDFTATYTVPVGKRLFLSDIYATGSNLECAVEILVRGYGGPARVIFQGCVNGNKPLILPPSFYTYIPEKCDVWVNSYNLAGTVETSYIGCHLVGTLQ